MPKFTIIATGGTIASLRGTDGAAPTLTAAALARATTRSLGGD